MGLGKGVGKRGRFLREDRGVELCLRSSKAKGEGGGTGCGSRFSEEVEKPESRESLEEEKEDSEEEGFNEPLKTSVISLVTMLSTSISNSSRVEL